jgi:hypothetical protein
VELAPGADFKHSLGEWKMSKIRMIGAFIALAMISLVSYGVLRATEPTETAPTKTAPIDSPYESSSEPQEEEFSIQLHGSGRQATTQFELESGLTVIEVKNDGKANFIVELIDQNGDPVTNLFNEIDKFEGRRAFNIAKPGAYLLDVQATGPWNFTIKQPRVDGAEAAPQTFKGEGMDVTPFVTLPKGLAVFEFEHQGEGRGIFTLLDSEGRAIDQVANQLDDFQGSKPFKVQEEGVYLLNVYGQGKWTVKIK